MKTTWLNILLGKLAELKEDKDTLVIDGDLSNINKEIIQYKDGSYENVNITCTAYTENYIYVDEFLANDSYQEIRVSRRNPKISKLPFYEINIHIGGEQK